MGSTGFAGTRTPQGSDFLIEDTPFQGILQPLEPFHSYGHRIRGVRALEFDTVAFPPGHAASKLERGEAGKYIVVKKSAETAGIITAYFKRLPHLVPGAAAPCHSANSGRHLITDTWIFCHDQIPPFLIKRLPQSPYASLRVKTLPGNHKPLDDAVRNTANLTKPAMVFTGAVDSSGNGFRPRQ
jgi:hypothetical protein